MANKPNSYPKVPGKAWAALRKRAVAAPTIKITGDAVAALLEMSNEKSAMDNIVYPLRRLGLIDDDGALTERGGKWRTDAGYGDACDEILADVYPEALSQLTGDNGAPNPPAVRTWFDQQGFGASNAKQMARTYLMIASKEIPAQPTPSGDGPKKSPANKAAATKAPDKRTETGSGVAAGKGTSSQATTAESPPQPSLHLDIQIHIPPDASAEQLDKIFESMARHLSTR